ncbi:MAG TPA: response regulator transcription factor [Pyrinomonadaceae bacterium]|nr:response regulator transcription factor [Pyrinomonadaceae bacterium]
MTATQEKPIRILLVDDHKIIRDGLADLIRTRSDMQVIGDAGTGEAAIALALSEQPDVIVLDLDLGLECGLSLLPELIKAVPSSNVIVLTGMREVEKRDEAMMLGAKGMVLKEKGAMELLSAIEKVHRTGEYWFEPGAARRLFDKRQAADASDADRDPEARKIGSLTKTERDLITCIGDGMDNREIASRMHIAESTVRNSLTRIYDKLEIKGGRLGLLVYAYRHGIVKPAR